MRKGNRIRTRSCDSHVGAARIGIGSRAAPARREPLVTQSDRGDILTLADPGDILTLV